MASSVQITSPALNNAGIIVAEQAVDADGAPVGVPVKRALLDDGDTVILQVGPNKVLLIAEAPRNQVYADLTTAAAPADQQQPSSPAPDVAPATEAAPAEAPIATIGSADPAQPTPVLA